MDLHPSIPDSAVWSKNGSTNAAEASPGDAIEEAGRNYETYSAARGNTRRHARQALRILRDLVEMSKVESLDDVTVRHVEQWQKQRLWTVKKSTVIQDVAMLRTFLRWAYRRGYVEINLLSRGAEPPRSAQRFPNKSL